MWIIDYFKNIGNKQCESEIITKMWEARNVNHRLLQKH
jgi:hypothetical protein